MDLNRIMLDLKAERDVLAAAIDCLERLIAGRVRKRGRPPACLRPATGGNQAESQGSEQRTRGNPLRHSTGAREG